ncbi:hypothetical protein L1765_03510 [Microaerobacter geothermalis]|uniref:hypothetical protein n=1 Tax=Microaerobacter geothermalis TaxID=674972 RepID=UPI001F26744D|nr:hypothetical protein [Microaerobacter geothermalis]MCF6093060.1 hypothetical protein [Microaerobacter geothermalis]
MSKNILIVIVVTLFIFISGCGKENNNPAQESSLPPEINQQLNSLQEQVNQLSAQNEELKNSISKLDQKINRLEQEKELRNIIDLKSRQFITALFNRDIQTLKEMVGPDVVVGENDLEYPVYSDGKLLMIQFPYPDADYSEIRQRWYLLNEDNTYITGMEVYLIPKHQGEDYGHISILNLTFQSLDGQWKVTKVESDI